MSEVELGERYGIVNDLFNKERGKRSKREKGVKRGEGLFF